MENATGFKTRDGLVNSVYFISINEHIPHNGQKIGDIVFKDNKNPDWNYLKDKLVDFARSSGANLVEVKTLGWGKRGQVFYMDASLYFIENEQLLKRNKEEACSIVIFRDGMEAPLGTVFKIDASINDQKFENLSKKTYFKGKLNSCAETATVKINNDAYKVNVFGRSKYFKVAKQTSGGYFGDGVQIGVGGVYFVEIEDEALGRLLMNDIIK